MSEQRSVLACCSAELEMRSRRSEERLGYRGAHRIEQAALQRSPRRRIVFKKLHLFEFHV